MDDFGYALGVVQQGGVPPSAKPWKGEGPGVLENTLIATSLRLSTDSTVASIWPPYWLACYAPLRSPRLGPHRSFGWLRNVTNQEGL